MKVYLHEGATPRIRQLKIRRARWYFRSPIVIRWPWVRQVKIKDGELICYLV